MEAGAGTPPRSMTARAAAGAARVERRRRSAPNGIWGMALFLCSEATIFGTLMATYFYLDFDAHRWPPAGIERPTIAWPSIATGWLVLSMIPIWLASRSARRGARRLTLGSIWVACAMQCLYLAAQILLFRHDLLHFSPKGSAYGSIYFTMLAADHAHVALGIALDAALLLFITLRGLANYWLIGVRGLAIYWYAVTVITVLVLCTQLSPSF